MTYTGPPRYPYQIWKGTCEHCGRMARHHYQRGCGVWVCIECKGHEGLVRCFCGWAADGGDGRAQLRERGEIL